MAFGSKGAAKPKPPDQQIAERHDPGQQQGGIIDEIRRYLCNVTPIPFRREPFPRSQRNAQGEPKNETNRRQRQPVEGFYSQVSAVIVRA